MSNTLIFVEIADGAPKKSSLAGITFGQSIKEKGGGDLILACVGSGVASAASSLTAYADKVVVVDDAAYENYLAESYTHALHAVIQETGATTVAAGATSTSKDLLPRLAARVDGAMASDVLEVVDAKTFKRPMWAGNAIATVTLTTPIRLVTVRPTEFDAPKDGFSGAVTTQAVPLDVASLQTKFVSRKEMKSERPDATTADRVVSGGRGVKGPEGFALIEQLADKLGAGVGASRAVCDAGWVPNDLQIGQTGKVVAPNLYIAVGISGAIQHLAGMKGSKTIVAINKDAEAPIFQVADYGLVADLFEAVPELVKSL